MRASEAMWRVMWVFCQAHLSVVSEERRMKGKVHRRYERRGRDLE